MLTADAARSLTAQHSETVALSSRLAQQLRDAATDGADYSRLDLPFQLRVQVPVSGRAYGTLLEDEQLVRTLVEAKGRCLPYGTVASNLQTNGFRLLARVSKAREADPLEFAPVIDAILIQWATPTAVTAEDGESLLPYAVQLKQLTNEAKSYKARLTAVMADITEAAGNGRTSTKLPAECLFEPFTKRLCETLRNAGFKVESGANSSEMVVSW